MQPYTPAVMGRVGLLLLVSFLGAHGGLEPVSSRLNPTAVTAQVDGNNAEFVSQTVQEQYYAGNVHQVSITLTNVGTTTWTQATHRLVSMNPYANDVWGRTDVKLPSGVTVAPGATYTFNFNITVPTRPSRYNFQWQMRKTSPGSPANFGAMTPNVVVTALSGDAADFISQSVPTFVEPGNKFDVQLVFQNRGSSTWTYDTFRLVSLSNPAKVFGKDSISLNPGESIAPGQFKTYNFRLEAPKTEGVYNHLWQLRRSSVANFGPISPTVPIEVRYRNNSTCDSQTVPTTMFVTRDYDVSVRFTNTGVDTWTPGPYALYSQSPAGNNRWGKQSILLPVSVAPGESYTFNFTVKAPTLAGMYNFQWRLRRSGKGDFGAFSPLVAVSVEEK